MKTKKISSIFMFLFISVLSIVFTACSSSDDDDSSKITSPIVGVWKTSYYTTKTGGELIFKSDGTYYLNLTTSGVSHKYTGKYEVSSGSNGVVKFYDQNNDVDFWQFELSSDNKILVTTPLSSSSLTWIRQ